MEEKIYGDFVYLGKRFYTSKPSFCFALAPEGWEKMPVSPDLKMLTFPGPFKNSFIKSAEPGAVFRLPYSRSETGWSVTFGPKADDIRPVWPFRGDVVKWTAEEAANIDRKNRDARARKLVSENALTVILSPIRDVYRKSGRAERASLLSAVISFLTE